ncbi:MAG: hypothetical protein ACRCUY_05460 [Thermoguttaceae bacterium]
MVTDIEPPNGVRTFLMFVLLPILNPDGIREMPFPAFIEWLEFFLSRRRRVHGGFFSASPCPPCLCAKNKPSMRSHWSLLSGSYFDNFTKITKFVGGLAVHQQTETVESIVVLE